MGRKLMLANWQQNILYRLRPAVIAAAGVAAWLPPAATVTRGCRRSAVGAL